ncbi:MAG TPA: IclR family transcriptional regulator [Telmatospirillum sp.]|nr:IclR family transcriptional regulator [Telmatospirillum sp.]
MTEHSTAESRAKRSPLFINSVEKAFAVLTAFDGTKRQLSLTELAASTGIGMSAAQRCVHTLTTLGCLTKDADSGRYELSPRLLSFAHHYLSSNDLVTRAEPSVRQLALETEEAVSLTIRDDTDIVFVLRYVSRKMLFPDIVVGSRVPVYCSAPGLAMLSCLPQDEAASILTRSNLVAYTPSTVTDQNAIVNRLRTFRTNGYAHTREEYFLLDMVIAAAITDARGRPQGAVSVAVGKNRFDVERDESRLADLVMTTAARISAPRRPEVLKT